jgi:hypothetical protein
MSVEWRLRQYAQALARKVNTIDQDDLRRRTPSCNCAEEVSEGTSNLASRVGCHLAADRDRPGLDDGPDELLAQTLELEQELLYYQQYAEKGHAASALRAAELLELLDRTEEAAAWWYRAAAMSDPDAIAYVQHIPIAGTVNPSRVDEEQLSRGECRQICFG